MLRVVTLALCLGACDGSAEEPSLQDAEIVADFRPDRGPADAGPDAVPSDATRDAAPLDATPLDAAAPAVDAHAPDAARADADPEARPDAADAALPDAAAPFGGFDPAEIDLIQTLTRAAVPPDPTNRFADDPAAAHLGQALFYSPGLSPVGRDCAFCHPPERAFSGELSYDGHGGLRFRHAPSLLGAAFQPWFFWDGHADTLWAQVQGPLEDPEEMAATRLTAIRFVNEDAELRAAWTALFGPPPALDDSARFPPSARPGPPGDPLTDAWNSMAPEDQAAVNAAFALFSKALAAYVRRLHSFDSPFDTFAAALATRDEAGLAALSPAAQRGLRLFIGEAGCVHCHAGPTFSDGAFHNVGLPAIEGRPADLGRFTGIPRVLDDAFNAAGPYSDDPDGPHARRLAELVVADDQQGRFKTPTLRNVARTGPWMHDGRYRSLLDVVRFKATLPGPPAHGARDPLLQPLDFTDDQLADLVAFLESLTGGPPPPELVGRPAFE